MLRGHIAPTEPVEHSCTCYIVQEHITHVHTQQPRTDARTHIRSSTRPTHKKDRVQRIRLKRVRAMRKKKRETHLDRGAPTGRKICRQHHFTEV